MPIPWSSHGPTVLTTDLGLWWLCMKALSPEYDPQIEEIAPSEAAPAPSAQDPYPLPEQSYYDPNNSSTQIPRSFDDMDSFGNDFRFNESL